MPERPVPSSNLEQLNAGVVLICRECNGISWYCIVRQGHLWSAFNDLSPAICLESALPTQSSSPPQSFASEGLGYQSILESDLGIASLPLHGLAVFLRWDQPLTHTRTAS
jgi:hypothetical protein